ncbi:MAG: hypothetical protein ACK4TP_07300 [Hyphomicrobium sp.]|jgi:hypothetical protein
MRIRFEDAELAVMQREYEETPLTVAAIGVRHGCSGQYVCKLAKLFGWKLRSASKGTLNASLLPPVAPSQRIIEEPGIAQRLCKVIKKKLDQMEKNMDSGELSSADLERDAKAIASMIGGMQKVVPVPDEDKVSKPDDARCAAVANTDEVERLQREIIERFERIEKRRQAERGSQ